MRQVFVCLALILAFPVCARAETSFPLNNTYSSDVISCDTTKIQSQIPKLFAMMNRPPPERPPPFPAPAPMEGICLAIVKKCGQFHIPAPGTWDGDVCHTHQEDDHWICGVPVGCEGLLQATPHYPVCSSTHMDGCEQRWRIWQSLYGG
jgi:hypothetical protein